jgi:hypothetical protein
LTAEVEPVAAPPEDIEDVEGLAGSVILLRGSAAGMRRFRVFEQSRAPVLLLLACLTVPQWFLGEYLSIEVLLVTLDVQCGELE